MPLEDFLYLKQNSNTAHWTNNLVSRYDEARTEYEGHRGPLTSSDVAIPIQNPKGPQATIYDPDRPQSWARWFWDTMGF